MPRNTKDARTLHESLNDLPQLHPRTRVVEQARFAIWEALILVRQKYQLTYLEALKILNEVAADELRYAIREERHPGGPDKKGDEA